MKTCSWKIKLYYDERKENLMYEKDFKNVNEILNSGFKMPKNFYYDCCRQGCKSKNSRKMQQLWKYRRLVVEKISHKKDGDVKHIFSV